jgi:hypothetical protein
MQFWGWQRCNCAFPDRALFVRTQVSGSLWARLRPAYRESTAAYAIAPWTLLIAVSDLLCGPGTTTSRSRKSVRGGPQFPRAARNTPTRCPDAGPPCLTKFRGRGTGGNGRRRKTRTTDNAHRHRESVEGKYGWQHETRNTDLAGSKAEAAEYFLGLGPDSRGGFADSAALAYIQGPVRCRLKEAKFAPLRLRVGSTG